jgi:hypothetical protein
MKNKVYKVITSPGPNDPFGPFFILYITKSKQKAFEFARKERLEIGQPADDENNDYVFVVHEALEPHEWLDD